MKQTTEYKQAVDTLICAEWIACVDATDTVLQDSCVAIADGQIIDVCSQKQAGEKYIPADKLELGRQLLIPGLVNSHGHAAMTLLRGYADDLPLMEWLEQHIWPAESRWVDEDFARDGVTLAIAEMLSSGTTCFSDMYFFPNVSAEMAHQHGIRAQIAFPVMDLPTAWASSGEEYLEKGLRARDDYKSSAHIDFCFGPHSPYIVSRETLSHIATLSDELDVAVHIHLHETAAEVHEFKKAHGVRPLAMLDDIGLCTPRLQCVHMCHTDESDIEILQRSSAHVIHCPRSNLKLASGYCQTDTLLSAGVNVALGTDGAASNNSLNMLGEMSVAALLGKNVAQRADAVSATQALRMATINGAKALGLDNICGSIEVGKQADIVAVDLNGLAAAPLHDPVSTLVYGGISGAVSKVWIGGQLRCDRGQVLSINNQGLRDTAERWLQKMQSER